MRVLMSHRLIQPFLRVLLGCMVMLLVPRAVSAQDSTPIAADLIVTVRDVQGAPLAGLTVQIRAGADTIHIVFDTERNDQGRQLVTAVAVIDNGAGMLPLMARLADQTP